MAAKRNCKAKTKKGKACGAAPLKPGTVLDGVSVSGDYCRQHDPKLPDSARIGGAQEGAGRPRLPKPTEIMRRLVEEHVEVVLAPHFRTLGYDVERDKKSGELQIVAAPNGGAKIFGESKEGAINFTDVDDLGAHIAAAEKLLDRIYGRPKQATELTGAEGGPVELVPVSREKARAVGEILGAVGAGGG